MFSPYVPQEVLARRLHDDLRAILAEEKRLERILNPILRERDRARAAMRVETRIFEREQAQVDHYSAVLKSVDERRRRLEERLHTLRGAYYKPYTQMVPPPAGAAAPAGQLPIVTAGHQRFYFDARLQEFRDVRNPMRSFALKSDEGQALFSIYVNQEARRH